MHPAGALRILAEDGRLLSEAPDLGARAPRELFVHMLRVRCLDQRMLTLQRAGRIGFVGTARGLEAAIIGSAAALEERDWLWSGLREGGAALMRGLPLAEYVAQMYGNAADTAKGRQMCNHFQHQGSHYPSWSSVIGTQIPHGVGAAYASMRRGDGVVHGIWFGDGAVSSNGFHSGMNLAGVWRAPAVFVCIDNGWAISVPSHRQSAGGYEGKGRAYGIPAEVVDGNDLLACYVATRRAVERARSGAGPGLVVLRSYRMLGHSSSDDATKYRSAEEVAAWEARCPIERCERWLLERGELAEGEREVIERELLAEIDAVVHEQENVGPPPLRTLVEDVWAEVPRHLRRQFNGFLEVSARLGEARRGDGAFPL